MMWLKILKNVEEEDGAHDDDTTPDADIMDHVEPPGEF